ncbi:P-loop containing nucleoside triphosphate hydrolase protein [Favolaschia claudopus]|uniref:P-loop containing nucleoside triphosphate hydrolase protein n=1 Tax=Favolaschia claudopus TaxID=2862362 RepID=A0AAW0B0H1_9AGAR
MTPITTLRRCGGRGVEEQERDRQREPEREREREEDEEEDGDGQNQLLYAIPPPLEVMVGDAALADADPLGVNQNVTAFDEVGGLDDHIHALEEMTLLPLLYPEMFQQFRVTARRGVLFHGPPGTGKTLLARALAASCRSNGRQITFFMRKGADILSKWVGEAEHQLRLLFEEARAHQPSIIFFDEIDGLAPVRSSKQDQIQASIVATLLARTRIDLTRRCGVSPLSSTRQEKPPDTLGVPEGRNSGRVRWFKLGGAEYKKI